MKSVPTCPICGAPATYAKGSGDYERVSCRRCGDYKISRSADIDLNGSSPHHEELVIDDQRASIAYWLRQQQRFGLEPLLTSNKVEQFASKPWFPSVHEQIELLLRYIGKKARAPGVMVDVDNEDQQFVVGARTPEAIEAIVEYLIEHGLLADRGETDTGNCISLTVEGWLRYEDLQSGTTSGKNAFLAMPFNKPDLDDVWVPRLRAAVEETGFTLSRVDDNPRPGLIDVRMRLQIKEARFLIVELTHANLGAHWEAGFAEGLGKPVIYTCKEGEKPHFDVDHSLRIVWNPGNIDDALTRLKATIRNELPDAKPDFED